LNDPSVASRACVFTPCTLLLGIFATYEAPYTWSMVSFVVGQLHSMHSAFRVSKQHVLRHPRLVMFFCSLCGFSLILLVGETCVFITPGMSLRPDLMSVSRRSRTSAAAAKCSSKRLRWDSSYGLLGSFSEAHMHCSVNIFHTKRYQNGSQKQPKRNHKSPDTVNQTTVDFLSPYVGGCPTDSRGCAVHIQTPGITKLHC
jgi:hypothetical protein